MATAERTLQNFVDGEFVDVAGELDTVLNPATGETIAAPPLGQAEVDRAVAAARPAFDAWGTRPRPTRATLSCARRRARGARDEIAELESANAGKPIEAFRADEIPFAVDNLRFFAGAARCMEGKAAGEYLEGHTSIIRREPIGVIGQIAPWNYPLMMAIWKIGPALAAGQHDRPQAGRDDAADDAEARRAGAARSPRRAS